MPPPQRLSCSALHRVALIGFQLIVSSGHVCPVLDCLSGYREIVERFSRDHLVWCRMVADQDILESGDLVVVVSDIVASDNKVRSVQLRHVA